MAQLSPDGCRSRVLQVGRSIIGHGQRQLVDRHDRRDLNLFRIGWDRIEKVLVQNQPIQVAPAFIVSGGYRS